MTREDRFIEQLETYLEEHEGLTPLPDTVRDAVRASLPTTKQAGPLSGLARFTHMNTTMRYGVAAAVVGLAALLGWSFFGSQVGQARPTPTPPASTEASTSDTPLPADLQHPFLGPTHDLPDGWTAAGAEVVIEGTRFEYNTSAGGLFLSRATLIGPAQFQLEALDSNGCERGDLGMYSWELSPGGNELTLTTDDDACASRGAALAGTWLRSDCKNADNSCLGTLEPGTYASGYFEPRSEGTYASRFGGFTYTVPEGWAAPSDLPDVYLLTTQEAYTAWDGIDCFDCPGTRDLIAVLSDPGAATEDCGEEGNVRGVGFGADDLLGWMQSHPGLVVGDVSETTISGFSAHSFTITGASDWTGTCGEVDPFVATPVFYRVDSYHWALSPDESYGVTLIDIGDGHTVAVMVDSADEADLDGFIAIAAPIIATFDFPPR